MLQTTSVSDSLKILPCHINVLFDYLYETRAPLSGMIKPMAPKTISRNLKLLLSPVAVEEVVPVVVVDLLNYP